MRLTSFLSVFWISSANAWVAPNHQAKFQKSPTEIIDNRNISRRNALAIALGLPLVLGENSIAVAADDPLDAFGKALSSQTPSSTMMPPSPTTAGGMSNRPSDLQKTLPPTSSGGTSPQSTPQTLQGFMDEASKKRRIDPRTHG